MKLGRAGMLGVAILWGTSCSQGHGRRSLLDGAVEVGGDAVDAEAEPPTGLLVIDLSGLDAGILNPPGSPLDPRQAARTADLVGTLSQAQKLALIEGVEGAYVGNVAAVAGLPALTLQDGPAGVAVFRGVTAFPAPITLAASWNRELVQRYGAAMAAEERGKGVMIQLGPMMNLARAPQGGRIAEGFGEDPFLAAELTAADVLGIQSQKVVATAKHFVANEQETNRLDGSNSQIDERTLHEIYYAPFEAAVSAGVGAVMCSYNRLNGTDACANPVLLADLKQGMGFAGFVMTDWGARGSGLDGVSAGLDMAMPSPGLGSLLGSAIAAGKVPQARLDDMVTRILGALVRVGVLDEPPTGTPDATVTSAAHAALAKEAATAGITLLKNKGAALPIDAKVKSIAVIGQAADSAESGAGGSAAVNPSSPITPLSVLQAQASSSLTVTYARGEGKQAEAVAAAAAADVAIVFARAGGEEGYDMTSLGLSAELDALIAAVAAVNARTIVVLNVTTAVLMPWLDHVSAVLVAWGPGEQSGNAIAPILLGSVSPGGKLPVSFVGNATDLPKISTSLDVPYSEGLAIGYRGLDARGIAPLFPFGHGLSYTTFAYSELILRAGSAPGSLEVQFTVKNTGSRAGVEIAQLYLSFPEAASEPPRVLRGFERVSLNAGKSSTVTLGLSPRHFACWNSIAHAPTVVSGTYRVAVGGSSRDLPLSASVRILGLGPHF
jgi:beta-glucosidase